jgi:hypothetical protein
MAKLVGLLVVLMLAVGCTSSAAASGRVCGFIRASVPYSHHGNSNHWRVYVTGATSCHAAEEALDAVMHRRGAIHEGRDEAHSFFIYRAWTCPFGHMGFQACNQPGRSPYRARALAVKCAENGCPSNRPPSYFR